MRALRTASIAPTAAAATLLLLTVAGCSSGSDGDGTPVAGPTVTVTETATVTQTPTASSSPSASTSAPAGPECGTAELRAKVRDLESGAGQRNAAVVLTNTSSRSCTVTGYPGLQLRASGGDLPTKVVRLADPAPRTVKLAPGASAASTINFSVIPAGSEPTDGPCEQTATTLLVTPPDATTSLQTKWTLGPVCSNGRMRTNAFVAGNGG